MTLFDEVLEDIDAIEGCPQTKRKVIDLLETRYGGDKLAISQYAVRRHNAKKLLEQLRKADYPTNQQVRVLMARIGVDRSTAYRWVSNAKA